MPYFEWIVAGFSAGLSAFAFIAGLLGPLAVIGLAIGRRRV